MTPKPQKSTKTGPKTGQNVPRALQTPPEASHTPKQAPKAAQKSWPVWALILALIGVVGGATLFVCAAAGLFNQPQKVTLDPEYLAATSDLTNADGIFLELLTPERYQELVDQQKSFLLFVDQTDCTTANRLRGYLTEYTAATGVKPYRLMFSDLKQTSLKGQVKYYPSVVLISDGQPIAWLKTDSEADAPAYNDYAAFESWLNSNLNI